MTGMSYFEVFPSQPSGQRVERRGSCKVRLSIFGGENHRLYTYSALLKLVHARVLARSIFFGNTASVYIFATCSSEG